MVERERGSGSIRDRIRRMVIEDPMNITTKDILAKLKPKNDAKAEVPSKFMIESLRTDTRQTLRLLKDMGHLTKGYVDSVKLS
jgi:hypothetical protein